MNINFKNEKGITMIAIVITIIILLIIISTVSFSSKNGIDMKKLNNMYADIILLEEKIAIYYLKNGNIPIKGEELEIESELKTQLISDNPNNGTKFYEIDLDKLENISLNNNNTTHDTDKYIINYDSHTIYYLKGVTVNEYRAGISGDEAKTYYGVERDYAVLDVENLIYNTINAP